jgi:hypothetical protein
MTTTPDTAIGSADDEPRVTALACALYVAKAAYTEARKMPNPAATMDEICDAWPEIAPQVLRVAKTTPEQDEVLKGAVADRLWAYSAVEYARVEAGDGYGYLFDLLAEALAKGANPHVIRTDALAAPRRLRELAEAAA